MTTLTQELRDNRRAFNVMLFSLTRELLRIVNEAAAAAGLAEHTAELDTAISVHQLGQPVWCVARLYVGKNGDEVIETRENWEKYANPLRQHISAQLARLNFGVCLAEVQQSLWSDFQLVFEEAPREKTS